MSENEFKRKGRDSYWEVLVHLRWYNKNYSADTGEEGKNGEISNGLVLSVLDSQSLARFNAPDGSLSFHSFFFTCVSRVILSRLISYC